MPRSASRTHRARWLAVALAAASVTVLLSGVAGAGTDTPTGEEPCNTILDPDCEPSTTPTSETTSTTLLETTTSTTIVETTTTTFRTTTTAARATPTTAAPTTTAPSTTTTITSTTNLLVPGDGSDGSESTTTTVAVSEDEGISEATIVWMVIFGLIAVAILIGFLTYRYWLSTRPVPPAGEPDPVTRPSGPPLPATGAVAGGADVPTAAHESVDAEIDDPGGRSPTATSVFRDP